MEVINLTPHDVHICNKDGVIIKTFKKSSKVARTKITYKRIDYVDGVPIVVRQKGNKNTNLPDPQEGVMYIVSTMIMERNIHRTDLLAPAQEVRINGRVIGCQSFARMRRKS